MPELLKFLDKAGDVTGIVVFLIGIVTFFARERISQGLKKKFTSQLEEEKKEIQKEIEDHRASLALDAEKIRYGLDISRSIDLKFSERRTESFNEILGILTKMNNQLMSYNELVDKHPNSEELLYEQLVEPFERFRESFYGNLLFYSDDLCEEVFIIERELRENFGIITQSQGRLKPEYFFRFSEKLSELRIKMIKEIRDNQAIHTTPAFAPR